MASLPEGALMQRAAAGLAYAVIGHLRGRGLGGAYGKRIVLLVGSGDNGGDALYAGALLARRGARVEAWLLSDRAHAGGVAALKAAGGTLSSVSTSSTTGAFDVVVDGIVGIGGKPGLRPDAEAALALLAGIPVVSVDTPSGVCVDSGEVDGAHVTADLTVTFGTYKPCHLLDPAASACGTVQLVDIGLRLPTPAVESLEAADVADLVPRPAPDGHKYSRGVVGLRVGSATYPGAALLAVSGANTGLAGMVRYVGTASEWVKRHNPEVVGDGQAQAWVVGSGSADGANSALAFARASGVPLVIDADSLRALNGPLGVPAILTPHAGELAALIREDRGEIEARPLHYARLAAKRFDAVVLLKGRRTTIASPDPDTPVRVNTTGTSWLATAGSGDVLGGLIGSLLAAGLAPIDAASAGAWLHGAAATLASAGGPVTASGVAAAIPAVIRSLPAVSPLRN
ncbi:bifunctional ADP-dependent NAD(P)H-hydrate dehydratase/NAD(P)H-hydrate epimerase [Nocardioides sp. NBC_00850]|uniref:bifunctional ADP-dependent NAD(P)H-hydrate dehydratase/NAD(P)H-hydrate epimerase n=1 Tax=Nocardioides sp. NBC_00850 TaxID=2976001 RepID=UPI003864128B|nr:bifunctional ADP-dependent NAD(P)H-hydrate dehydratase/NAD(P)H-hydrate epimerase [Nocardioides sp. NBC_00850]